MAFGHWKIPVDETFPMGSIVAQDMFQWKLNAIFLSIPGVTDIADDMIIYGRNDQET